MINIRLYISIEKFTSDDEDYTEEDISNLVKKMNKYFDENIIQIPIMPEVGMKIDFVSFLPDKFILNSKSESIYRSIDSDDLFGGYVFENGIVSNKEFIFRKRGIDVYLNSNVI